MAGDEHDPGADESWYLRTMQRLAFVGSDAEERPFKMVAIWLVGLVVLVSLGWVIGANGAADITSPGRGGPIGAIGLGLGWTGLCLYLVLSNVDAASAREAESGGEEGGAAG